ncbi:hypothetical protein [Acinetobacter baumannii]|uniref:hypothetical protein n=1 Tax=Acinetobacter baumannii TaxID=470 RepID=UPI003877C6A4
MEEIISAAATIQGAKLQANAALWGALFGFLGVIFTIIGTWLTVLRSGKVSRLAELRREVYLETVEAYSQMLAEFGSISKDPLKLKDNLYLKIEKFGSALDKTMFVCNTETKAAIVSFYEIYIPALREITKYVFSFIDAYEDLIAEEKRHDEIMVQFQKFYHVLDELKIEDPTSKKFKNIFDLLDNKIKDSSKIIEKIEEKEKKYNDLLEEVSARTTYFIQALGEKSFEIMYLLREEIDIKNNTEFDKILNERLKNIK